MMRSSVGLIILLIAFLSSLAQDGPKLVDEFGREPDGALLARIDNFWIQLKDGSQGVAVLTSTTLGNYLNKRRIEGCNLMRRYPKDSLIFVFEKERQDYWVRLWKIPKDSLDSRFVPTKLDYRLPQLDHSLELTSSMAAGGECPLHFDIAWYANFLRANPTFTGKAVFNTRTNRDFLSRVAKYRRKLTDEGIDIQRVRFFRRHFNGETDEQFWLIPQKKR